MSEIAVEIAAIQESLAPWLPLLYTLGAMAVLLIGLLIALQRAGKD